MQVAKTMVNGGCFVICIISQKELNLHAVGYNLELFIYIFIFLYMISRLVLNKLLYSLTLADNPVL